MSDSVEISSEKLPEISHDAMWHMKAGLIVSPSTLMLPDDIAGSDNDFSRPRALTDGNIWMAFYHKNLIYNKDCHVFSYLSVSDTRLVDLIQPVTNDLGFVLHPKYVQHWSGLEQTLLSIINTLHTEHAYATEFPTISFARWP